MRYCPDNFLNSSYIVNPRHLPHLLPSFHKYLILSCGILFSLYILQDLQMLRDETARSAAAQEAEQRFDTYLLCIYNVYVPVSVLIRYVNVCD